MRKHVDLGPGRCLVMGIVNRTPDSFFDGGRMALEEAVEYGLSLVDEGADLLDVGGVKAGPGPDVDESEELRRLIPVVEALSDRVSIPLSVETGRPRVAREAIDAGASIVNDVTELLDPQLATVCAELDSTVIVMHNGGQIRGRPRHPRYDDVVRAVLDRWDELAQALIAAGVKEKRIVVDPGLDFGKTTFHSLELMRRLDELVSQGRPVLVAPSRKDVVGETLGLPLEERLEGTLALVAVSVLKGAKIVRVHDVAAAARVVRMTEAVMGSRRAVAPVRGLWD